ncbi:NFACT family protein [Hydrogenimonas sp.]
MKQYQLQAVVRHLSTFRRIKRAERLEDNLLRLQFERGSAIGFDLSRGRSAIFDAEGLEAARRYHAPFDTVLKKRLWGADIVAVSMPQQDRIIRIDTELKGAYKSHRSTLWLEFTGRHTNAIILDEEGVVLEALRHVDEQASYRVVRPGVRLDPLPPYTGRRSTGEVSDVEAWLKEEARKRRLRRLEEMKGRHRQTLTRKIERLERELKGLADREALEERAKRFGEYGAIVLAHLHAIKPYDTELSTVDFEGNPVTIELPPLPNPKRMGEHFYTLARRAANKAANLHIEEENLRSRIAFYRRLLENLEAAGSEEQIALLFPPKQRHIKKETRLRCEEFRIGEYRLLVGRNERENLWVLRHARAQDLWLHLKDRPSSHCIIQSGGRRQVPKEVVLKAAKICVETSVTQPGDYLVDVTYRRNVKILKGAHVHYVDYDTIKVSKQ